MLDTVTGLLWGAYVGSPADTLAPVLIRNEVVGAQRIVAVATGELLGLEASTRVITHETKSGEKMNMLPPYS